MPLTVKSLEKMPGVHVVYPVGSLDTNTFEVLEKKLDYLIGEGKAKLITLDLAGLEYISSAGIRVVFKAKKQLQQRGGSFTIMNLQPQIRKVFEIINALPSLQVFASIEEMDNYLAEMQRQTIHGKE